MEIFGLHPTLVYAIGHIFWIGMILLGITLIVGALLNKEGDR